MSETRSSGAADLMEWQDLKIPRTDLAGMFRNFGPGLILMMTGIGTSHVITAPTAGGRFAYALLWCIPVAYVFKYYGFEMAFRFTHATGKSLLEAYATAWKKWPLWYMLVVTLIQCAIGQAGRLIASAAVPYYLVYDFFGVELPISLYALILAAIAVAIIWRGNYQTLETGAKIFAGVLVASCLIVYALKPAPVSALRHFFVFSAPEGSWLIIAGFLGLLPTGIDVSLQASEWGKAKKAGMARVRSRLEEAGLASRFDPFAPQAQDLAVPISRLPEQVRLYCGRWFRIGLWDFRVGHLISMVTVCLFLLLSAVWLYPSDLEGTAVMGKIAEIFIRSIGPWSAVVFFAGAFAALYSTAFNYFDGWPRVVGACCRNLFRRTAALQGVARESLTEEHRARWYSEYNIYRITMLYSLVAAVAIIAGLPRPVFLVLVASALAFFIAPVIYFLNIYYCMAIISRQDKGFYPSPVAVWVSCGSFLVFTGLTVVAMLEMVFKIHVFGGA